MKKEIFSLCIYFSLLSAWSISITGADQTIGHGKDDRFNCSFPIPGPDPAIQERGPTDQRNGLATLRWYYYPTTNAIALNPSNPSILYSATDNGIYKSVDGGISWRRCKRDTSYCLAIHPVFKRVVFAGKEGGSCYIPVNSMLFISTDSGHSWTPQGVGWVGEDGVTGRGIRDIRINPEDHNIIYVDEPVAECTVNLSLMLYS